MMDSNDYKYEIPEDNKNIRTVEINSNIVNDFSITETKQNDLKSIDKSINDLLTIYINKFYGIDRSKYPKRLPLIEMFYNTILSFTGILMISITDYWYLMKTFQAGDTNVYMLIGSFAATAVLVFDLHTSPYSQPRNVIGGHVISAFIGVSIRYICQHLTIAQWIQAPLAVCFAILSMDLIECIHPPGGASALISVIGGDSINNLGYGFILTCLGGAIISVAVAAIGNNLIPSRQYPAYWI